MKTKATAKKRYCAANLREVAAINLDFHEQFGSEMVQISAILFSRHCHRAIFFYFHATATCATFFSLRQWRGGTKSGASAQH